MQCPHCGAGDRLEVKDTRRDAGGPITRRRRCTGCGRDFRTVETVADANVRVRKSDGSIVGFSGESVTKSVQRAAVRRRRHASRLGGLAEQVRGACMQEAVDGIVNSVDVGRHVLAVLRHRDPVSFVRYALVHLGRRDRPGHRGWADADDFRDWLAAQFPELRGYRPKVELSDVVKRDWRREPFDPVRLERSIGYASKGRDSDVAVRTFASQVADDVQRALRGQPLVTSGQIAAEILRILRARDHVAFLRYASAAKGYESIEDYETEAVALRHT